MTTEYVVVHESATVEGAIAALKSFEASVDAVNQIFLIDNDATLTGAVTIGRIALAAAVTPLKELAMDPLISIQASKNVKRSSISSTNTT